jgi:hypothetical protein
MVETSICQMTEQNGRFPPRHLRKERDSLSEILCSLEYQTIDKVQKLSNPDYLFRQK